ncbi:MAG: Trk system potassium transporter TrkA [Candidatus Aphodosoma sp.]
MKIIIVGAGAVGRHVAKMLSNESHDIVIMDENEDNLQDLDTNYDVMTKIGSSTSIGDLQSCNIRQCDLFIAVTPHESANITACMIAKKLGARKTVARIDNYEYLQTKNIGIFQSQGIDRLIYPEVLAATEIVQAMRHSWIREYRTFADGALILLCVKVRNNSEITNKEFKTGFFNHGYYRIVAVKRHAATIIPNGNDQILANDLVYFICTKENLEFVRKAAGKTSFDIKNVIIMGGSKIAVKTVQYLPSHINVKIIESDRNRCLQLSEKTDNLIIHGDGRNVELLRAEGIEDADAFIALTGNSETNILSCMAAKRFGIRKTIAEVENIDYIDLADNLDIGMLINKKIISASYIYQQTLDEDAHDVQCLTYSDAEVVEFVVKPGDKITRSRVRDLWLPESVNIGGIIRNGKGYVVNGNTVIQPGDHVVIFCKAGGVHKLSRLFNS